MTLPNNKIDESEMIARLRLTRSSRVGPATYRRLIDDHKTAGAALLALPDIAKEAGVKDYSPCAVARAESEFEDGIKKGYTPLVLDCGDYPTPLAETPDAPPFLWVKGNVGLLAAPSVAIVGARNVSPIALSMAGVFARELAGFGYSIVSGLARGCDTAAHTAAVDNTIAVVASGLDVCYPEENADLMDSICERGLCISELPIGMKPQAQHFPQRNRIIAGLCPGVVIVEAATRSGSLITARCAHDLGREVMAMPAEIGDARGAGCNEMIRYGAMLVRSGMDIHNHLQLPDDAKAALRAVWHVGINKKAA